MFNSQLMLLVFTSNSLKIMLFSCFSVCVKLGFALHQEDGDQAVFCSLPSSHTHTPSFQCNATILGFHRCLTFTVTVKIVFTAEPQSALLQLLFPKQYVFFNEALLLFVCLVSYVLTIHSTPKSFSSCPILLSGCSDSLDFLSVHLLDETPSS